MTTPDKSQDIPLAEVRIGLSEIVLLVTMAGSLLTAIFGHDWGVSAHAQDIAEKGVILLPMALGLFRSIKHHGVARANAIVVAAQPAAVTSTSQVTAGTNPTVQLDHQPATSDL